MKNFLLAAVLAASLLSSQIAAAQVAGGPPVTGGATTPDPVAEVREVPPKNLITTNVLTLLAGFLGSLSASIEYERVLSDRLSIFVTPGFEHVGRCSGVGSVCLNGIAGLLGMRYFFGGQAPRGFFIAPVLHGDTGTAVVTSSAGDITTRAMVSSYGGAVAVGHTWLLGNLFDISVGLGGGTEYFFVLGGLIPGFPSGWRPLLLLRTNIGFAF